MIPAIIVLCRLAWHIGGHNIFGQENIEGIRGFLKICRHRHYLEKYRIDDNGLLYEVSLILLLELADNRAERIATDEDFMKFLIARILESEDNILGNFYMLLAMVAHKSVREIFFQQFPSFQGNIRLDMKDSFKAVISMFIHIFNDPRGFFDYEDKLTFGNNPVFMKISTFYVDMRPLLHNLLRKVLLAFS